MLLLLPNMLGRLRLELDCRVGEFVLLAEAVEVKC